LLTPAYPVDSASPNRLWSAPESVFRGAECRLRHGFAYRKSAA
jgi:hypothetical protein